MVWQAMAVPVNRLSFRLSIMATWVLSYPLQHMHMAVNTAMSLAWANPPATMAGIRLIAAPAEPSEVTGTDIAAGEENPKSGTKIKLNFSPSQGKNATPS